MYNFMDTLNKASSNPVPVRPTAPKPEEKQTLKPQFAKELYFQQRAKSARSQRVTGHPKLPPRPKSVGSIRYVNLSKKFEESKNIKQTAVTNIVGLRILIALNVLYAQ